MAWFCSMACAWTGTKRATSCVAGHTCDFKKTQTCRNGSSRLRAIAKAGLSVPAPVFLDRAALLLKAEQLYPVLRFEEAE